MWNVIISSQVKKDVGRKLQELFMIRYLIPLTQDTFDNVRVGVLCAGLRAVADRCGGGGGSPTCCAYCKPPPTTSTCRPTVIFALPPFKFQTNGPERLHYKGFDL